MLLEAIPSAVPLEVMGLLGDGAVGQRGRGVTTQPYLGFTPTSAL